MTISPDELEGMTTNERLFATGQSDAFDRAVAEKNFAALRQILESVLVDEAAIRQMIHNVETWGTAHDPTWTLDRA
jgi:hypothetical protein